ncbi:MAG: type I 3-dehydroquinate dehydratase [Microvirga sp.]
MDKLKRRDILLASLGAATLLTMPDQGLAGSGQAGSSAHGTLRVKNLVIGEGRPKIIVSITGASQDAMLEQARSLARLRDVDIVEFRVDHLDQALNPTEVAAIATLVASAIGGKPLLTTFRTKREGGEKAIDGAHYAAIYDALLGTKAADLLDLELAMLEAKPVSFVQKRARAAGVPVLLSHHDFSGTPPVERMLAILAEEADKGADICKLAVMPKNADDVIRLLDATCRMRAKHPDRPLLTMAMGGLGAVTRISGEIFGAAATFGKVGGSSAPGQLDVADVKSVIDTLGRALEAGGK